MFQSNTDPSVTVLQGSLVSLVRLMLMSVPADLVTMEPLVLTNLRDTLVSVQKVSQVSSVKMKCLTVWREPALTEQCAKISLDLVTLSVFAEMDSRERTVTSPQTHAQRMVTHASMRPHAEHCHKEDILVSALRAGRVGTVRTTLMIVWSSHVSWVPTVLTWSMTSAVTVLLASLARDVSRRLTCVLMSPVLEVNVLTKCSDMSVSVNLAGQDRIVKSTLMTVGTAPVRIMDCVLMMSMDTLACVSLASLVKTVNTLWTIVLMNHAKMVAHVSMKVMAMFVSADLVIQAARHVRLKMMNVAQDPVMSMAVLDVLIWTIDLNAIAEMDTRESSVKSISMTVSHHPVEMVESVLME